MQSELELMAGADDPHGSTSRIKKAMAQLIREISLVEKLDVSADIAQRVWERAQKIDANTSRTESFLHSLANVFKFSAGEAERVYPSKKK
jgi:hypothetical protein